MIFSDKKFKREVEAVRQAGKHGDFLNASELASVKGKVFSEIRNLEPKKSFGSFWALKYRSAFRFAISSLVGISLVGGTALASNTSNPGDVFYPIKQVKEKIRLSLSFTEESIARTRAEFAQERLRELEAISLEDIGEVGNEGIEGPARPSSTPQSDKKVQATSTEAVVPTLTKSQKNSAQEKKIKILQQAKQNAEKQVEDALTALEEVKGKLEVAGNKDKAEQFQARILELKLRAKTNNLKEREKNSEREKEETEARIRNQIIRPDNSESD